MFAIRKAIFSTVSFAALAAVGLPSAAYGQDTSATQPPSDNCVSLATQAEQDACREREQGVPQSGDVGTLPSQSAESSGPIVVTGSRIRRSEFNSPDPVTIIDPQQSFRRGQIETAEIIQSSPIAAGSIQIDSVISNNFVTNGGADAQTVSLRGLGAERTLVLLNGRRAGPAGVRGAVASFDLNVLPSSIIRSVEILKTGASSIYGSDAVAGVVNILTRRSTNGIEVGAFTSIPFDSGGETYNVNASFGREFSRGSFLITADYFRRQNLRRADRDFLDCSQEYLTYRDGGRADIVDPRTGQPACNGTIGNLFLINNDFTGPGFSQGLFGPNGQQLFIGQYAVGNELDGVCVPVNGAAPGVVAPANFFGCNFSGPSTGVLNQYSDLERNSDVISDVERYTIFAQGDYELTPGIEAYTELLYNKRKTHNNGYQQFGIFQFTGSSDLPFFFCDPTVNNCDPGDAGDPFNADFAGNFLLQPLALVKSDFATNIDYYRGVFGLRGDFGGHFLSGWHWDVYGQYSRSEGDYTQDVIVNDALRTAEFRTRSCAGQVTPISGRQCIDLDFTDPRFLSGNFTDAERAFLFGRETGHTRYTQFSTEATLTGTVLRLPAGDLGVALGATARRDAINDTPGDYTLAGNVYGRTSAGITAGHTWTKEVYGEVDVPLIHDAPFIQRFSVTGAARYTSVEATRGDGQSDSFSDTTWKIGAEWQVFNWLRFRGSWGTSFRAPALFELFLENQTGFQNQQAIDICINTQRALDLGTINQRIFDNCAASGIPSNFAGATGSALITSGGGLGNLRPETSTAKSLSVILTPETRGILWGGMQVSFVLDYFDIGVRNEITTLGAANIVLACYNSQFFPTDPVCDQITRAPAGSPEALNITDIRDTYLNINSQDNRGFDATIRVVQDLDRFGSLTLLGQMTWQLDDTTELFEGTRVSDNGEAGDPKWVGNFDLTWNYGKWALFYNLNVVGGTSNLQDLLDAQGSPCRTSIFRPGVPAGQPARPFCQDVRLSPTFYHSASITRQLNDRMTITAGISNIFNRRPPRASTALGQVSAIGQAPVFGSQYDYLGRRVFVNVRAAF